jgi:LCP family protein required for cell wall assembly
MSSQQQPLAVISAKPQQNRSSFGRLAIVGVLLGLFMLGGAYSAYYFYITVKAFVVHAQLGLPSQLTQQQNGESPDEVAPSLAGERVNILLLGTDKRLSEQGPSRTDTMIVVTVDPETKTAGMLSIPRDLWVPIPGHSENRINVAHFLGELDKYPGGGPALAKKTVQYTLGIPIHYYVRINFEGFEKLLDAIGGIKIDVKSAIHDEKYPDNNYGYMTVDIPAGVQQMNGKTALQYARARHGSSDFSRARRQQEVLRAVRDKVLSLNIPLTRIPEMLKLVGDSVQTDISLSEMYSLAKLARDTSSDINSVVIDESMTTRQLTPDGADVLLPNRDLIREAVNKFLGNPNPTSTAVLSDAALVAQEAAKMDIQNGTLTPGLAQRIADHLKGKGYNVVSVSNADRSDYAKTILIDYSGKENTVRLLTQLFQVAKENVRREQGIQGGPDIRVILGRDVAAAPLQ